MAWFSISNTRPVVSTPLKPQVSVAQPSGVPRDTSVTDSIIYSTGSDGYVDYQADEEILTLFRQAKVKYKDMELSAEKITFYTKQDLLVAEGVVDSSSGKPKLVGSPVFNQGGEELRGLRMTYNLKTKRGTVIQGRTEFEKGRYRGEKLRRIDDKTLEVAGGTYTTCDLEQEPHYHFYGRQMKVLLNDKVIAKPIIFYLEDVPLLWFPFYVFPIKKGRHSGILVPSYGASNNDGRYMRNLGYYWAPSDYWDNNLKLSLFEKTGWMLEEEFRYAKRYNWQGSIGGSFKNESFSGERVNRRGDLWFRHDQTLSPTVSLKGSGNFVSDKNYIKDTSFSLEDRLNRTLHSDIFLDKRWTGSGSNFQANLSENQYLDTSERTEYLPRLSFRTSRKLLFGEGKSSKQTRRGSPLKNESSKWYESIYYSFSSDLVNYRLIKKSSSEKHLGVNNRLDVSASDKIAWFNLSPDMDYQENWYNNYRVRDTTSTGDWRQVNKPTRQGVFSTSLSVNTTIYGLFRPEVGNLKAIRHVVKPSFSFNFSLKYKNLDRLYSFGGLGGFSGSQKRLNVTVGNIFQIKTEKEKKENKFDLAYLDFSTAYDFEAKIAKLSPLSTSFSIKPPGKLDIRLTSSHNFYDTKGKLRQFPKLEDLTVTTSFQFSGRGRKTEQEELPSGETRPGTEIPQDIGPDYSTSRLDRSGTTVGEYGFDTAGQGLAGRSELWRVSLSHHYSLSRSLNSSKTSWLRGSADLSPTKYWRLSYSFNYDMKDWHMTTQDLSVYRDLHCWEARMNWTPSGLRKGYYFVMNIKALPDIKVEKSKGAGGFSLR